MKPILYSPTETAFDTNGIGILNDAIRCSVRESLNGQYELTMRYPVEGIHFAGIVQRAIILAKPDPITQHQPFRIYRITKPMGGIVTIYARHIAYDLMGIPVGRFSAASAADALRGLNASAATDCPFSFSTDKSTSGRMNVMVPTPIWTLLGGSEGSILDIYGGEYEFDRWRVNLWNRRGADRGVSIRYGKNLTSLEQDENCANCYTGVYPYWADSDGNVVELSEKIVNAQGTYSYKRIMTLDLSQEWQEAPTQEQLRQRTEKYISDNDIGVPTVSWKIEFVQLEQTEEYKHLGLLEQVLLGDTVTVIFPDMNVNATARVVEVDYDPILERYNSITLGSVKANLASTIVQQNKEIQRKPSISLMQSIVMTLTSRILGAKGGAVRLLDTDGDEMPDTLYVADNADPALAKKVWRWNYEGWAGSKNGYNGPFTVGATLEDGILASAITAANLVAGTIQSADDARTFFLDLDNGILRMNATELSVSGKTVDQIAQESVDVGGTNLVLRSDVKVTGNGYPIRTWNLSGPLEPNTQYTLTVNGCTNNDKTLDDSKYLRQYIYTSDWSWSRSMAVTETADTTRSITFTTPSDVADKNVVITAYYYPSEASSGVAPAGTATVNWVKLEKGNQATDWSPAPADLESYADRVASNAVKEQTQTDIFNKLTNNGQTQGIYMKNGKLYINMEYADTGQLKADNVTLRGLFKVYLVKNGVATLGGYLGYKAGSTGDVSTDGIAMMNANQDCYSIVTTEGVRTQAGNNSFYVSKGQSVFRGSKLNIYADELTFQDKVMYWKDSGDSKNFTLMGI